MPAPTPLAITFGTGPAISHSSETSTSFKMHRPGRTCRYADERQRLGDVKARQVSVGTAIEQLSIRRLAVLDERGGQHDHVGRRAARHPRRHAIRVEIRPESLRP